MANSTTDTKITIDLNETEGHVFSSEHIIHHKEMDRALGHIKDMIANVSGKDGGHNDSEHGDSNRNDSELGDKKYPSHNAILVEGGRGAGKTSFLHSLEKECAKDDSGENAISKNAYCLPFLDPTLIEEKAHIFLTIISLIKEAAKKHHDAASKDDDECSSLQGKCEIESRLEKLSKGLPSVADKAGLPDYWDNDSLILHKGLEDVRAAFHLRQMFVDVVNSALKELRKKVFILFIDDVDTDFSKTLPLLETLRKYLTTDKIITVISGDFRLISAAVRGRQWENFGETLLKNDCNNDNGKAKYSRYVSELESQYLQKIFRSELRIKLRSLNEVAKQDSILVTWSKEVKLPLRDVYANAFETLGMKNPRERGAYTQFILGLPVRTQIQMLKALWESAKKGGTESGGAIDSRAFTSIFMTDLVNKDIDIDKILANDAFLTIEMLKFLVGNGILNEYYQLEPTSEDDSINGCITALSVLFSLDVKENPVMFFDYALRIPYMRNLKQTIESGGKNDNGEVFSIEGLAKYAGMYTNRDYRQMVCYATAYLGAVLQRGMKSGIVELMSLYMIRDKGTNTIDYKIDHSDMITSQKYIAYLPLSISAYADGKNSEYDYSVFTLLASIADIVYEATSDIDNGVTTNYEKMLSRMAQVQTYLKPSSESDSIATEANDEPVRTPKIKSTASDSKEWELSARVMSRWIKYIKESHIAVSSYLVSKIITRCYYAFIGIRDSNKGEYLIELMPLFICEIIHAAIIEEYIETHQSTIEVRNIRTKTDYLAANLEKVKGDLAQADSQSFAITQMLITCPFLIVFLNKNDKNDILGKVININKALLVKDGDNAISASDIETFYDGKLCVALHDVRAFMAGKPMDITTDPEALDIIRNSCTERGITYKGFSDMNEDEVKDLLVDVFSTRKIRRIDVRTVRKVKTNIEEQGKKW